MADPRVFQMDVSQLAQESSLGNACGSMTVLVLPDYVVTRKVCAHNAEILKALQRTEPGCEFRIVTGNPPFTDDQANGMYFEARSVYGTEASCITILRRDAFTAAVSGLRDATVHRPELVIGVGQGGLAALFLRNAGT